MPSIPHSKRMGAYLLEHARVMVKDHRVVYETAADSCETYFGLPTANLSILLLGAGTSLTQQAAKLLSEDQTLVAFVGGEGAPLFMASQSEYREPKYLQGWYRMWTDPGARLAAAQAFAEKRCDLIEECWASNESLVAHGIYPDQPIREFRRAIRMASEPARLIDAEGAFARSLYGLLKNAYGYSEFKREHGKSDKDDLPNSNLDQGNYLAYGLAGVATWALGIPHSLPLIHGDTRRGGLVFDVADLIKDAIVMPCAFESAANKIAGPEFKSELMQRLHKARVLDVMFDELKLVAGAG